MTTHFYFDAANDYRLWVFAQQSDGTLAAPVSYATAAAYNNGPYSVTAGDLTGDGLADVVVGLNGLGVQVFPQLASGGLGAPTLYSTPDGRLVRLGRLDDDPYLDVAAAGWGTNTVSVLRGDGAGGLQAPVQYAPSTRATTTSRSATSPVTAATTSSSCPARSTPSRTSACSPSSPPAASPRGPSIAWGRT
jgi:hypothetical protein